MSDHAPDERPAPPALLLAAGAGSRLRPLTDHVPKPMLPIDGEPVIGTLLDQLGRCGVADAMVVVGHLGDVLRRHLEAAVRSHPDRPRCSFVEQPQPDGSAHAMQCARAAGLPARDTLVAATDTVWRDEDVDAVVDAWRERRPMVTMALRRWPLEQLPHRSAVAVDDELRVARVLEKPDADQVAGSDGTALSGSPLYVVRDDFWPFVDELGPSDNGKVELAVALQAAIDAGNEVLGCEVRDTRDLTRPGDLLRANFPYLVDVVPEL